MNAMSLLHASVVSPRVVPPMVTQFGKGDKIVTSNKDTLKNLLKMLGKNKESFIAFQKEHGVRVWKFKAALTYISVTVEPLDGQALSDDKLKSLNAAFDQWLGEHSRKELPPAKVRDRSIEKGCCNKSCKGCIPGNSKNAKLNIMA